MKPKIKQSLGLLASLTIVGLLSLEGLELFTIETVFAQGTPPTTNLFQTTAEAAALLASVLEFLAFIAFRFLQFLLDPNFILGLTDRDYEGYKALNSIWQWSRDIMNVIFAFILVGLGIVTVVTADKSYVSNYFKKFILAVILVNFSWWFPRVILDVANVLTATIYQLPAVLEIDGQPIECKYVTGIDDDGNFEYETCKIIVDIDFFQGCKDKLALPGWKPRVFDTVCFLEDDYDPDTNTAFGMLNGLVVNYGKLGELTRVLNPNPGGGGGGGSAKEEIKDYFFFLLHIIFVLALMIMLALPLIAMLIVFLIRIPIIWITIAFMPFMFIGFLFGSIANFNTYDLIFNRFVKAAFLPTVVAIPFAIGFVLLNAMTGVPAPPAVAGLAAKTGPFLLHVNSLWGMMWLLLSFIVIWTGFFMALNIDDIYSKAAGGIKGFGESIGKAALRSPLALPIIPVPKGGSLDSGKDDGFGSAIDISRAASRLGRTGNIIEDLGSIGGRKGGGGGGGGSAALSDVMNNPNTITNQTLRDISTKIGQGALARDASIRNADGSINRTQLELDIKNNKAKYQDIANQFKDKAGNQIKFEGDEGKLADALINNPEFKAVVAAPRGGGGGGGGI